MKTFFDGIFIDSNNAQNENEYSIKLEYYKTIKTEENGEAKYGIQIVETEFIDGKVNVESKIINGISNSSDEVEKMIEILRNNEVTPIGIEDAINEITII